MLKKNILNNVVFYNYLADPWKEGKHLAWAFLQTNHLFFSPVRKTGLHLEKSNKLAYKYRFVACLIGQYVYSIKKQVKLYSLFLLYFKKLLSTSLYRKKSVYFRRKKLKFKRKTKYNSKKRRRFKTKKYKVHVYLWYKKWFRKKYKRQRRILWKSFHRVSSTFWGNLLKKRIKSFIFWMLKSKNIKSRLSFKTYDEITKNIFYFMKRKKRKKKKRSWKNRYKKYKLNLSMPVHLQRIKSNYLRQNHQNLFPYLSKKQFSSIDYDITNNNFLFLSNNFLNSMFLCFPKINLFLINYNYFFYFLNLKNKKISFEDKTFIFSNKKKLVRYNDSIIPFYYNLSKIYKTRNINKIKKTLIRTGVLTKKKKFSELQHGKYINIFLYWFDCFLKKHTVNSKLLNYKLINRLNLNFVISKKYNFHIIITCFRNNLCFYIKNYKKSDFLLKKTLNKNNLLTFFLKDNHLEKNNCKKKITSNKKWYKSMGFHRFTRHENRRMFFYPYLIIKKKKKIFYKKKIVKKNLSIIRKIMRLKSTLNWPIVCLKKLNKYKHKSNRLKNLKILIKLRENIKLNRIGKTTKIKKTTKKKLFLKLFKKRKRNIIFHKIKKYYKILNFIKNRKIIERLKLKKKSNKKLIRLKVHKHKRNIFFQKDYKFNKYLSFKKKRRHFLKKYKRKFRRKLYFISKILPKINKKKKIRKKKRDLYFKNKYNQKLLRKLKTYFKPIKFKKKNLKYLKKKYINTIIKINKKFNNKILKFLLANYFNLLKNSFLISYSVNIVISKNKNKNIIANILMYNIFYLLCLNNLQQFSKLAELSNNYIMGLKKLNKLFRLVKFYIIKRNKKKLKKYLKVFKKIKIKNNLIIYIKNTKLNGCTDKMIFLFKNIILMNIIKLNKNIKFLRLVYKKIKYNKTSKKYIIIKNLKKFFKKYRNTVYLKKYLKIEYAENIINKKKSLFNKNRSRESNRNIKIKFNKNILNNKKKIFKVELNFLKNKKIKKYVFYRKKYINKYYGKIFRNSSIYKEFLIHFIFRLKFNFRNINRRKSKNLKYRMSTIKEDLTKYIFKDNKLVFFLNNEEFIVSNLCISSSNYNNMYSKSLIPYYDWVTLEYSRYYFLNWLNYSNKILNNSHVFKHYFVKFN